MTCQQQKAGFLSSLGDDRSPIAQHMRVPCKIAVDNDVKRSARMGNGRRLKPRASRDRRETDGRCLLYAVGSQVVLRRRSTGPLTPQRWMSRTTLVKNPTKR